MAHVLIVDDDADARSAVAALMEAEACTAVESATVVLCSKGTARRPVAPVVSATAP